MCDNCGHFNLVLDKGHTKMHTKARIFGKVKKKEHLTEERLRFLGGKMKRMERTLTNVRRTLGTLVEKNGGSSRNGPLANGGSSLEAVEGVESGQLDGEPVATEVVRTSCVYYDTVSWGAV
jgi:hypothetical protein